MWGQPPRARGGGGGRHGQNVALLLMLLQRINSLDRKPPLTLGLMGLMYALHFQKTSSPSLFRPFSLCPDRIVHDHDIARLLASAFLHVDEWHLYHNMASFLWKGYHLEHKLGSARFAVATCCLLVLSQTLVVAISFMLATFFQIHDHFYQCSIGFSGVLFALKVLLNHNSPTFSSVYGFQVPTKYAAWLELVVIHYLVPHSSFIGHMCGILAGYIYVISPRAQVWTSSLGQWLERFTRKLWQIVTSPQEQPPLHDATAHHGHRPAASRPSPEYESDESLAQRLQEEEFRFAERQQHGDESRGATSDVQHHLSQDELRRRRVERLNRQSRW